MCGHEVGRRRELPARGIRCDRCGRSGLVTVWEVHMDLRTAQVLCTSCLRGRGVWGQGVLTSLEASLIRQSQAPEG